MKPFILFAILMMACAFAFSQKPATPCCTIMAIGSSGNNIICRDNTTGLTFQFKASASDLNAIKPGDQLSMDQRTGKITAINGVDKEYTVSQTERLAPCCNITSIQADPAAPCCAIIAAANSSGGQTNFTVPKNVSSNLKIGQPVYFGPIDGFAFFEAAIVGKAGNSLIERSGLNMYSFQSGSAGISRLIDISQWKADSANKNVLEGADKSRDLIRSQQKAMRNEDLSNEETGDKNFNVNSVAPCCGIVNIDPSNNIVIARDETTGLTFQFKAEGIDRNNLHNGNRVSINKQAGRITSINGTSRTYSIGEPEGVTPCCTITSIKADPAAPCCNVITAQNNAGNNSISFSVPKNVSNTLRTAQPVYFGPIDSYAFIQSRQNPIGGNNAAMYSYSFSYVEGVLAQGTSTSGPTDTSGGSERTKVSNQKRNDLQESLHGKAVQMRKNTELKGATGRVLLDLPADVECFIYIYAHGSDKQVAGTSRDRAFYLMPGSYDIKVSSALLEEITVEKGMDTRIRAGVLNIVSPSAWALYDEKKEIRITGASSAKKIGLPVGNYQLEMSGTFLPVTIKDGETADF